MTSKPVSTGKYRFAIVFTLLALPATIAARAETKDEVVVRLGWGEISGRATLQKKCVLVGSVTNRTPHPLYQLKIRIRRDRLFAEREFFGIRAGSEMIIPNLFFDQGCHEVMANLEAWVTTCKMEGVGHAGCVGTVRFEYSR